MVSGCGQFMAHVRVIDRAGVGVVTTCQFSCERCGAFIAFVTAMVRIMLQSFHDFLS